VALKECFFSSMDLEFVIHNISKITQCGFVVGKAVKQGYSKLQFFSLLEKDNCFP